MAVIEDQHVRGPHPVLRSALWLGVIGFVGVVVLLYGWMLRRARARA